MIAWVALLLGGDDSTQPVDDVHAMSIGGRILVFAETTSTNDIAMRLGNEGGAHGTVVFAESQTSGRGRLGRAWPPKERRLARRPRHRVCRPN